MRRVSCSLAILIVFNSTFCAVALGENLYSVTSGVGGTSTAPCLGGQCFSQILMASWNSAVPISGVSISGEFGGDNSGATLTAILTSRIGPGTTRASQIATVTITPSSLDSPGTKLFSGLTLPAGSYYLVLAGPAMNPSFSYWYQCQHPTVVVGTNITAGSFGLANSVDPASAPDYKYAPASVFDTVNAPALSIQVTADTVTLQNQAVAFAALQDVTLPISPFVLTATASSGLTVNFSPTTPGMRTVGGSVATPLAPGTYSMTESQSGDSDYVAAKFQSFKVSEPFP
jgi:hypothetical protein